MKWNEALGSAPENSAPLCLVPGAMIERDMNFLGQRVLPAMSTRNSIEKALVGRRVVLPSYFSGLHVQHCVKPQGAAPVIFKAMPFGASGRKRQHGNKSIQSLNGRLLVAPLSDRA